MASDQSPQRIVDHCRIRRPRPHFSRISEKVGIYRGAQPCSTHATMMPQSCHKWMLSRNRSVSVVCAIVAFVVAGCTGARPAGETPDLDRPPSISLSQAATYDPASRTTPAYRQMARRHSDWHVRHSRKIAATDPTSGTTSGTVQAALGAIVRGRIFVTVYSVRSSPPESGRQTGLGERSIDAGFRVPGLVSNLCRPLVAGGVEAALARVSAKIIWRGASWTHRDPAFPRCAGPGLRNFMMRPRNLMMRPAS